MHQFKKNNGCTKTPNMQQIGLYFLIILNQYTFYGILIYNLHMDLAVYPNSCLANLIIQIIASIIFLLSTVVTCYYGLKTTLSDPTDDLVFEERLCRLNHKYFDTSRYEFFCNSCQTHVETKSKHCKKCNRCVSDFDHHCIWINNCVGGKNYKIFYKMIQFFCVQLIIYLLITTITLYTYVQDSILFAHYDATGGSSVTIVITLITYAITILFFAFDSNLTFFHNWLQKNDMSTLEWIIQRRKRLGIERKSKSSKTKKVKNNQIIPVGPISGSKRSKMEEVSDGLQEEPPTPNHVTNNDSQGREQEFFPNMDDSYCDEKVSLSDRKRKRPKRPVNKSRPKFKNDRKKRKGKGKGKKVSPLSTRFQQMLITFSGISVETKGFSRNRNFRSARQFVRQKQDMKGKQNKTYRENEEIKEIEQEDLDLPQIPPQKSIKKQVFRSDKKRKKRQKHEFIIPKLNLKQTKKRTIIQSQNDSLTEIDIKEDDESQPSITLDRESLEVQEL